MTDTREYNEENERTKNAMDAGEAGVNEDTAFDGDANTNATAAGAAPDSSADATDQDGPPVDGGVVGGVPGQ